MSRKILKIASLVLMSFMLLGVHSCNEKYSARPSFPTDDPTFGVPGVTVKEDGSVEFRDEAAMRKWLNLESAEEALHRLREKLRQEEERLRDRQERLKAAGDDEALSASLQRAIERIKKEIEGLREKIRLGEEALKKAREAAKECDLDGTRKWAQVARESMATGKDTSGGDLGFPDPKAGDSRIGVNGGDRGDADIKGSDYEKFKAVLELMRKIWEAEKSLEDLKAGRITAPSKISDYEKRLEELRRKFREAVKILREMEKVDAHSMEAEVMREEAARLVDELNTMIENLGKELEEFKRKNDPGTLEGKIRRLKEALGRAYQELDRIYERVFSCDTEGTRNLSGAALGRLDGVLKDINDGAGGEGGTGTQKSLDGGFEKAEKKADQTGRAAGPTKPDDVRKANDDYFNGLYERLLANFLRLRSHADHSVNDFLGFKGENYQEVVRFRCNINGQDRDVVVRMRWGFGDAPPPDNGDGHIDGKYECDSTASCGNPVIINLDCKVFFYEAFGYRDTAGNKGLLYHELLHGQLHIEWLRDPKNHKEICRYLNEMCKPNPDPNVNLPGPDEDEEHKDIYPWQKKFTDGIKDEEERRQQEEKEKYREKYRKEQRLI